MLKINYFKLIKIHHQIINRKISYYSSFINSFHLLYNKLPLTHFYISLHPSFFINFMHTWFACLNCIFALYLSLNLLKSTISSLFLPSDNPNPFNIFCSASISSSQTFLCFEFLLLYLYPIVADFYCSLFVFYFYNFLLFYINVCKIYLWSSL